MSTCILLQQIALETQTIVALHSATHQGTVQCTLVQCSAMYITEGTNMVNCGNVQNGEAAAHLPGQLPQHQQHAHGQQVPSGAAATTGTTAGAGSGNADQQQGGSSGSVGQQPSGSGSTPSGTGGSSAGGAGSSGGGAGNNGNGNGGGGPGRGQQGGSGGAPAGGESQSGSAEQAQQGQQAGQGQPAGSWAAANYGYVWNMPQWVPATSMALFAPAMGYQHMQYAGQTNPASVAPELQVGLHHAWIVTQGSAMPACSFIVCIAEQRVNSR